jgi:hypothetical protein
MPFSAPIYFPCVVGNLIDKFGAARGFESIRTSQSVEGQLAHGFATPPRSFDQRENRGRNRVWPKRRSSYFAGQCIPPIPKPENRSIRIRATSTQ